MRSASLLNRVVASYTSPAEDEIVLPFCKQSRSNSRIVGITDISTRNFRKAGDTATMTQGASHLP